MCGMSCLIHLIRTNEDDHSSCTKYALTHLSFISDLEHFGGIMASMYTELVLYGSKNECARTDTVFLPISEVCNSKVSLGNEQKQRKTSHAEAG